MYVTEAAQKNRRLKFWKETLNNGALNPAQKEEMQFCMLQYQECLSGLIEKSAENDGVVSTETMLKLSDLERKLEQLAETSRLEAGKSKLLNT